MRKMIHQLVEDSEENYVNATSWKYYPVFHSIRTGRTDLMQQLLPAFFEHSDAPGRMGESHPKEPEYMAVSLVNTFMIAALLGGAYPPDANRIADRALEQIAAGLKKSEMMELANKTAMEFCTLVADTHAKNCGDRHVEHACQYIRTHLTQTIRMDDLEAHTSVSRSHLSHLFQKHLGKTVSDVIVEERIEAACQLLQEDSRSISEIASLLQYCDQSYFASVFKKKTGMTPKAYRQRHARMIV